MELTALANDPVVAATVAGTLALVLFAAAWHKLSAPEVFTGALQAYRLLPEPLVVPVGRVLPFIEVLIASGLLVPLTHSYALTGFIALIAVYALAMAVNLGRGQREIDCGCGAGGHPLSWGLVVRNGVLAALALFVYGPSSGRSLGWIDAFAVIFGVLAFFALYLLFDELLRQSSRLSLLRAADAEMQTSE